jgi:hypothetical protein
MFAHPAHFLGLYSIYISCGRLVILHLSADMVRLIWDMNAGMLIEEMSDDGELHFGFLLSSRVDIIHQRKQGGFGLLKRSIWLFMSSRRIAPLFPEFTAPELDVVQDVCRY